jgi:hypothetical protein
VFCVAIQALNEQILVGTQRGGHPSIATAEM